MNACRLTSRLVWRLGLLNFCSLMMLWFAACRPTGGSPAGPAPAPTTTTAATATATTTVIATATPAATAMTEGWLVYNNAQTGYTVEYPMGWTMDEQVNEDGSNVTTFTPPDGQAFISVAVQTAPPDQTEPPEPSDLPNTRCRQVKIGPAFGARCFDTLAFSTTTTLWYEKVIYTIATSGKGLDQSVYDHLVDSFRPQMRGLH